MRPGETQGFAPGLSHHQDSTSGLFAKESSHLEYKSQKEERRGFEFILRIFVRGEVVLAPFSSIEAYDHHAFSTRTRDFLLLP